MIIHECFPSHIYYTPCVRNIMTEAYSSSVVVVEESVTPTGNQHPQPRNLTSERSRRSIIRGIISISGARRERSKGREWGRLGAVMSENPSKRCRGQTERRREGVGLQEQKAP